MDAADLLSSFMTGTYPVIRRPAAQADGHGIMQPQPAITLPDIAASVQSPGGKDLQRLPEGRREQATLIVYTTFELQVGQQAGAFEADQIVIDGERWEVQGVEPWRPAPGNTGYFKAVVQSIEEQATE